MFIITEKQIDNTVMVVLGPMPWLPNRFKSCLLDDLEIEYNVPSSNDTNQLISVSDTVKIYPVTDLGPNAEYNSKIHYLNGPFYNYYTDYAEVYYVPVDKPIEIVKEELKSPVAANRYKYEIMGISHTIQGKTVRLYTGREDRALYLQAYQLGVDGVNWKFGTEFLTLSNTELGGIVSAVMSHVQSVFDWESGKINEIDTCDTLEELDLISVVSSNTDWEPVVTLPTPPSPPEG
jgi:hypothetical protein